MPLFTLAELQAHATGRVTNITSAEYTRGYEKAEAMIIGHCSERYENPNESSSKVFKQIGLQLALWAVGTERYNEQNNPMTAELWALHDSAVSTLKDLRRGAQVADAASVEVDAKLAKVHVVSTAASGEGSVFSDNEVSTW